MISLKVVVITNVCGTHCVISATPSCTLTHISSQILASKSKRTPCFLYLRGTEKLPKSCSGSIAARSLISGSPPKSAACASAARSVTLFLLVLYQKGVQSYSSVRNVTKSTGTARPIFLQTFTVHRYQYPRTHHHKMFYRIERFGKKRNRK